MPRSHGVSHPCRRVLVVEDDREVLTAIGEYLEVAGIEGLLCPSGGDALALVDAGIEPPDVVLVDLSMDGVDGETVIERIRAAWPGVPVAAMSGHPRRRFAYLPPVDAYLEKPFELERLNDTLSALCAGGSAAEA